MATKNGVICWHSFKYVLYISLLMFFPFMLISQLRYIVIIVRVY
jgi:hypothetical protein